MGFIIAMIIGFFVGLIARFLMPGKDNGGFVITSLLGIAGSLTANFVGRTMGVYAEWETAGFIASVLGAMLVLFIFRVLRKR